MLRTHIDEYLGKAQLVIYSLLAVLLSITTLAASASATRLLWDNLHDWSVGS